MRRCVWGVSTVCASDGLKPYPMTGAVIEFAVGDGVVSIRIEAVAWAVGRKRPLRATTDSAEGKATVTDVAVVLVASVVAFENVSHRAIHTRVKGGSKLASGGWRWL